MKEREIVEKILIAFQEHVKLEQKKHKIDESLLYDPSIAFYALIGNPIDKSKSAIAHNAVIKAHFINAIYLKIPIEAEELPIFFSLIRKMAFKGFSVTMPLKEKVMTFLDELTPEARAMGAVNTILIKDGQLFGYNTDGEGAILPLEKRVPLNGKKIVIIGAGGAAKAIAYTASKRKAKVIILNRTLGKAEDLAKKIHATAGRIEQIQELQKQGYDILINCTPNPCPIDPKYILPNSIIMDIRSQNESDSLLSFAKAKGADIIYGKEMWLTQAIEQEIIWFNGKIDKCIAAEIIAAKINFILNE